MNRRVATHPVQHIRAELQAVADGGSLREIQQDLRQQIILVTEANSADEIRGIFSVSNDLCERTGGAALGERVDRGASGAPARQGIGVDGHEQLSLVAACFLEPLGQFHIVVTIANHNRLHPGGGGYELLECARDTQHNVLFAGPVSPTDRPRILTTVAGIDSDYNALPRGLDAARLYRLFLNERVDGIEINHQPVSVLLIRLQYERARPCGTFEIQHHPQRVSLL